MFVVSNKKMDFFKVGKKANDGVEAQAEDGNPEILAKKLLPKDGELSVFKHSSGYSGADIAEYGQPGSNGLTQDGSGNLIINQHGNRRIIRLETDGSEVVLADKFEGKRLNSPNDLVYRSDGTLFFTDPPLTKKTIGEKIIARPGERLTRKD